MNGILLPLFPETKAVAFISPPVLVWEVKAMFAVGKQGTAPIPANYGNISQPTTRGFNGHPFQPEFATC